MVIFILLPLKQNFFKSIFILPILQLIYFGNQYINGADVSQDEDIFPQVLVHLNPCRYFINEDLFKRFSFQLLLFKFNLFVYILLSYDVYVGIVVGRMATSSIAPISKALRVQTLLRIYMSR